MSPPQHRHLVLFDLYEAGHHAVYFWQLCRYWVEQRLPGRLTVAVPPSYATAHPELIEYVHKYQDAGLSLYLFPQQPSLTYGQGIRALLHNDRLHGQYAQAVAEALRPSHLIFLYLDHAQLSLLRGLSLPEELSVAGILFRPTFHYEALGYKPRSLKERFWHLRKKEVLRRALRNQHLRVVFSLDPYAVEPMRHLSPTTHIVALPDGYTPTPSQHTPQELRQRYGIDPHRRTALFFGVVSERKGILAVLDSLIHLTVEHQRQVTLFIAGRPPRGEAHVIEQHVEAVRAQTEVQVIWENTFVPDEQIQDFFRLADLALVTYQRHIGSSHVLIRAAAEGVPVLASDYGVVGRHVQTHQLGMAVDTTDPRSIAAAWSEWLASDQTLLFDAARARAFAEANEVQHFATTIFEALAP